MRGVCPTYLDLSIKANGEWEMNYIPNMNAEIIPFQSAAGFCLGMKFDDFM